MIKESEKSQELIKKFRELKTQEEKCAFLHEEQNYPHIARIYNPIHFPKPAVKVTVNSETK